MCATMTIHDIFHTYSIIIPLMPEKTYGPETPASSRNFRWLTAKNFFIKGNRMGLGRVYWLSLKKERRILK
ncbi:hypothetical protein C8Z91_07970 [Paenibacillus elgii]|uniref:Uncharacterized protein n=1 Tax=Paenibacillus elgii TaxID=189691 RepID=A0A2T6G5C4_9BACL|nr:hypothetical protein C8Z91_07970 [Paenibacillus elgii]